MKPVTIKVEKDLNKMNNHQLKDELTKVCNEHEEIKKEMNQLFDKIDELTIKLFEKEKKYVEIVDIISNRVNGVSIIKKESNNK